VKNFKVCQLLSLLLTIVIVWSAIIPSTYAAAGPDSFTTHSETMLPSSSMKSVAYGNNIYVSVGYYGAIINSPDAEQWKNVKTKADNNTYTGVTAPDSFMFNGVAYGNGRFVAVGNEGVILTSADGESWTQQESTVSASISDVSYLTFNGSDAFYALLKGKVLTSTDGLTWTSLTPTGLNSDSYLTRVTVGNNGTKLAVGDDRGKIYSTTNGSTWTSAQPMQPNSAPSTGTNMLVWMKDRYFVSDPSAYIWTSTDLVNFTLMGAPFKQTAMQVDNQMFDGLYDGSNYYMFGFDRTTGYGAVYTSANGTAWTIQPFTNSFVAQRAFYVNGKYFRAGNEGLLVASNGSDWSHKWGGSFNEIIYDGTQYIAVGQQGNDGTIWTSTDLTSWSKVPLAAWTTAFKAAAIGNGIYVAVGGENPSSTWKTSLATSSNGTSWTQGTGLSNTVNAYDLAFGNGKFVVVGVEGAHQAIRTSSDGITWSEPAQIPSTSIQSLYSVTYANNMFIALGNSYNNQGHVVAVAIWTSADGETWTDRSSNYPEPTDGLINIIFDGSKYILLGNNGDYNVLSRTSDDLTTWSAASVTDAYTYYGASTMVAQKGSNIYTIVSDANYFPVLYYSNDQGQNWQDAGVAFTGNYPLALMEMANRVIISGSSQLVIATSGSAPVTDSTLSTSVASFDKEASAQADVSVTLTLNGNTLTGISNGASPLSLGTDYTVSGDVVTIHKAYLASQADGLLSLSFEFSAGAAQPLAVTVRDTTPPSAPSVTANDAANTITGLNTTMEYKVDSGSYVKYDGTNAPDLSGSHTVLVRVAEDAASGKPAGAATTLTFTPNPPAPAAPNVTANDAANTITGLDNTMEFKVDGGSYVKYDGSNVPDLFGSHTILVRVVEDALTGTPAGAVTTLTFTPNPPAPAAPSVSANDAANTITGLNNTMEFKVDGGAYVKYDGTNAPDLTGSHTVLVRIPADLTTGTPAGADATLTFTPNPPAPAAPNVTANDAANTITGLNTTMEFKVDGGAYVKYDGTNAPDLAGSHTVLVRVVEDEVTGTPAGAEKTLTFTPNPPAPAAPNVTANDAANTITGLSTTMEFKVDNGSYVKYTGLNAPDLTGSHTVLVRVAEDTLTGTPAGAEKTLTFTPNPPAPAAPNVAANDAANTITGLAVTMEFKVDGGSYVKYTGSNAPDLSGSHTVLVRVAEDTLTGTPAGADATLTFTPNPPAPAAPNVTADDAANTITGLNTTMEFKVDNGSYVKYDGTNAPDLSGSHTVLVRVAEDALTGTPAGAVATLIFTPNPPAPAAPSVTADDAANTITGLDTTMEFKVDGGSYVKYDGTNAPDLTGAHTVLVRIPADLMTGTPAGADKSLTFTTNPPAPAAPSVTTNDAANTITGLNTTMEFKVDNGSYVKYDGTNAPDLSGAHTVLVRIPADLTTGTPAGAEKTLTFTPNPPAPAAPSVTANDAANTITGLDMTMEFKVDSGSYVKYDGSNAPDLAGSHTVLVRIAEDAVTGTPAGAAATLTFTPNPPAPAAPSVTANDAANTITGLDTTMEFKVGDGSYVKYDGTNAPNLTGTRTVLVRIAVDAATGTPAGAETILTFVPNPPSAPTNVTAIAGNGQATVTFTVPTVSGDSSITGYELTALPGNLTLTGAGSTVTFTGLTNGTSYTFTVKAINASGSSAASAASQAVIPVAPTPTTPPVTTTPPASTTDVDVLVNGKIEKAGTATTTQVDNQSVTTIVVDQKKLDEKLAAEGQHSVVTIPVNVKSDVIVGELNGQMIKNMENKQAVLEIRTEKATYTLPAEQININAILAQLGTNVALQDIKIHIEISVPLADTFKLVQNAALKGEFDLVLPPLDFTVTALSGTKVIDITKFNAYIERKIALPDNVDPNKITTGIVVEPDGTVRHVPTKIVKEEGKYFAIVNSLTNSTYTVVWHPIEFTDVAKHWAKDAVNDMGSRLIINGVGNDLFNPNQDITRAEFAAIIVRGLGLELDKGTAPFSDIKSSDWYAAAIQTAYSYGLITGFADGTFKPQEKITREQAMVMIAKAMKITELQSKLAAGGTAEMLTPFNDMASVSTWAKDSVLTCLQAGVVTGRSNVWIAPKENMTRAEVAAIVQRLLQKSDLI
jgi:hypothetical protein